jgi:hypothetical protein
MILPDPDPQHTGCRGFFVRKLLPLQTSVADIETQFNILKLAPTPDGVWCAHF